MELLEKIMEIIFNFREHSCLEYQNKTATSLVLICFSQALICQLVIQHFLKNQWLFASTLGFFEIELAVVV